MALQTDDLKLAAPRDDGQAGSRRRSRSPLSKACRLWSPLPSGVYYAGGNGPHNGARNTSLGMMRLRMDGFAGLAGSGTFTTRSLLCTGPVLRCVPQVVHVAPLPFQKLMNAHLGWLGLQG